MSERLGESPFSREKISAFIMTAYDRYTKDGLPAFAATGCWDTEKKEIKVTEGIICLMVNDDPEPGTALQLILASINKTQDKFSVPFYNPHTLQLEYPNQTL